MRETRDAGCDNDGVSPTPAQQARAARIAAELAALGFALPGTLADRMTRCGRANCRCHADPPRLHGPYHQWTRKKNGRTATRILTDDQLADYAPWFGNHRRLRELITELEALSLAIAENDPRWNRSPHRPAQPRPTRRNRKDSLQIVWAARLTCRQQPSRTPSAQVSPNVKTSLVDSLIRKDSNGSWMPVGTNGCHQGAESLATASSGRRYPQGIRGYRSRPSDLGSFADLRIRTLGGLASARAPALVRPRDGLYGPGDRSSEELQAQQRDGQGRASEVPRSFQPAGRRGSACPRPRPARRDQGRRGHPARAWAVSGQCAVPVR